MNQVKLLFVAVIFLLVSQCSVGHVSNIVENSFEKTINLRVNVNKGDILNIKQKSKSSVLIIKDTSSLPSIVNGKITAKGTVILENSDGVFIGADGEIQTYGFVATTFNTEFVKSPTGHTIIFKPGAESYFVINKGVIHNSDKSVTALMGSFVRNTGKINGGIVGLLPSSEYLLGLKYGHVMYFLKNGKAMNLKF